VAITRGRHKLVTTLGRNAEAPVLFEISVDAEKEVADADVATELTTRVEGWLGGRS
jgi:hypothetical protein